MLWAAVTEVDGTLWAWVCHGLKAFQGWWLLFTSSNALKLIVFLLVLRACLCLCVEALGSIPAIQVKRRDRRKCAAITVL